MMYEPLPYGLDMSRYRVRHLGHSTQWRNRGVMASSKQFPGSRQSGQRSDVATIAKLMALHRTFADADPARSDVRGPLCPVPCRPGERGPKTSNGPVVVHYYGCEHGANRIFAFALKRL